MERADERRGKERADEDVVAASEVHRLEERVRELERLLGRKTMEVEILKEALDLARVKTDLAVAVATSGGYPAKRIAETLGSPFQSVERAAGQSVAPKPALELWAHGRFPAPSGHPAELPSVVRISESWNEHAWQATLSVVVDEAGMRTIRSSSVGHAQEMYRLKRAMLAAT
jgi:hypothetical protein